MAIPDHRAETIAKMFVGHVVCRQGAPRALLSDQGANFLSGFKYFFMLYGRDPTLPTLEALSHERSPLHNPLR